MIVDPNVEEVRKIREALVKRHGGLQGWIRQLQQEEKKASSKAVRATKHVGARKAMKSKPAARSKSARQPRPSKKRG